MKISPRISIIIPVYNCEKYLHRCLDSILVQTFRDWECILIDDGSTDLSGKILDDYTEKDQRFIVFHKVNGGVSSARNIGLDVSTGEYVTFMDADDLWTSPLCLEESIAKAIKTNVDIVRFDYKAIDEKDNVLFSSELIKYREPFSNQIIPNDLFFSQIVRGEFFCPLLLIRKTVIGDIRFNVGQVFLEDMDFIARLMFKVNSCYYIPKDYYAYRKSSNSAYRGGLKNIKDSFNMCYAFHRYASSADNIKLKEKYIWYSIMMYVWTLKSISYNDFIMPRKEVLKSIDINKIRKDILRWKKESYENIPYPLMALIPSKTASLLFALRCQISKIVHRK